MDRPERLLKVLIDLEVRFAQMTINILKRKYGNAKSHVEIFLVWCLCREKGFPLLICNVCNCMYLLYICSNACPLKFVLHILVEI